MNNILKRAKGMIKDYESHNSIVAYGFYRRDHAMVAKQIKQAIAVHSGGLDTDSLEVLAAFDFIGEQISSTQPLRRQ